MFESVKGHWAVYSAEIWPVTEHDIRTLKTFQMRCLQDILGLTLWDMHRNVDILKETGELPVEEQLRHMRLQWLGDVEGMPDHCPQKQLLKCRPQGREGQVELLCGGLTWSAGTRRE